MLKQENHVFIGMQLDLSPSKHKPDIMCDAHNVRIVPSDMDNTLMSLTNEKGTLEISMSDSLLGYYLGHCSFLLYNTITDNNDDVIIVFCTDKNNSESPDTIYKINLSNNNSVDILYRGNLNFNLKYPIESFFVSEAVDINKVYWNDGYNQPRLLILEKIKYNTLYDSNNILLPTHNTQFDFTPTLALNEEVLIDKYFDGGSFSPGVILYAMSYYNRWGQESNIFYISPLLYITFKNRGGSPDEIINNSFKITISKFLKDFDYIRVYSIHRTTLDAVPQCKVVQDVNIKDTQSDTIELVDNGLIGAFTDPLLFTFIGGDTITALTWDQKDNTLFLGNLKLLKPSISSILVELENNLKKSLLECAINIDILSGIQTETIGKDYGLNYINSNRKPCFKGGEEYRVGFQALYKDGSWSEPVWIKDYLVSDSLYSYYNDSTEELNSIVINCTFPLNILTALKDNGYKKIRGLCVFPKYTERNIVASGIVTPTIVTNFSKESKKNLSSWFFRPCIPEDIRTAYPEFRHLSPLEDEFSTQDLNSLYLVDNSILSFYSPDIEFSDLSYFLDKDNLSIKIRGIIGFDNISINKRIRTSSVSKLDGGGEIKNIDSQSVLSLPLWHDGIIVNRPQDGDNPESHDLIPESNKLSNDAEVDYLVYPWLASGPINNDVNSATIPGTSILKDNITSRLLDSTATFEKISLQEDTFSVKGQKVVNELEEVLSIVENHDGTTFKFQLNVDTTLMGTPYVTFTNNYKKYLDESTNNDKFLFKYTPFTYPSVLNFVNNNTRRYDFTLLNGKNAFTSVKYKSSPHLVLNTEKNIFPNTGNINYDKDFIIFNDEVIKNVVYLKLPEVGSTLANMIVRDSLVSPGEGYTTIQGILLLAIAQTTFSTNFKDVYDDSVYNAILKYKKEPFLIIVDAHDYPVKFATGEDEFMFTGRFIGIARMFKYNDSSISITYLNIDYSLGGISAASTNLDPIWVKASYKVGNTYKSDYFWIHSIMESVWRTHDNEQNSYTNYSYWLAIKGSYTEELTNISNATDIRYRTSEFIFDYFIDRDRLRSKIGSLSPVLEDLINNNTSLALVLVKTNTPYVFLCDILRNESSISNKFGGNTKEALKSNLWIPCSDIKSIDSLLNENGTIVMDLGDTWYLKYYCLKTYPYANTDENLIIDIAGFQCETRNNLVGVYDKSKPTAQLFINRDNFNKYNTIYNLSNNFFNYRILEDDFYLRDSFPYSIVWSKEKISTSDIDNYTSISSTSSLEANSIGGEISKIIVDGSQIFCFQPDGISKVLFNSRVLIPVSDGVPIEIANSSKVEGISNITNTIGCDNKWAICNTNSGIFFIDNKRKGLFSLGGETGYPVNLSAQLNMSNWFFKHDFSTWKRSADGEWSGTKLFDDYINNDLYLVKEDDAQDEGTLVYSKRLLLFLSFMSYAETDSIFNCGSSTYAFKTINGNTKLYKLHSGQYNYFYNLYKPFSFTFVSNGGEDILLDKTFTNVETRVAFTNNKYFSFIRAFNDYQDTDECSINRNLFSVKKHFSKGDSAKKFKIWRTDIPRVLKNNKRSFDRVRNTWTKIKLGLSSNDLLDTKMELHDISVLYHT